MNENEQGRMANDADTWQRADARKCVSLVVPVYNEEENVEAFYRETRGVMQSLAPKYDYEFVFTDNHSSDRTFELLRQLAASDPRVRVLRFSRNYGYQRSILTGYQNASGDAAIQLDCDGQDPPELIPEFLRQWEGGFEVVYGVRRSRQEGWLINVARKAFYRLIDLLSEDKLPYDSGDFRLVGRRVLDELRRLNDCHPYLRGFIATLGFSQLGVPYDRRARTRGESKFSLAALTRLAVDGILSQSTVPLRVATICGAAVSALTLLACVAYLTAKLVFRLDWPAGFATTTILILASTSINAIFLGIIGEYLGRIYQQLKKPPHVVVEEELNSPKTVPRQENSVRCRLPFDRNSAA